MPRKIKYYLHVIEWDNYNITMFNVIFRYRSSTYGSQSIAKMDNCTSFWATLSDNMTTSEIWDRLMEEEHRETTNKIPALIYMSSLILLGIVGNIVVILVYLKKFRPSTTKIFIVAMAVFDLCSCTISMPFDFVDILNDFELDIPIGCKIMRFFLTIFTYGSVLVLIVVAIDRFRRVCRPYSRQMSVGDSKKGILVIVIVSSIVSIPNLIFYGRQTVMVKGVTLVDCSIDDSFTQSKWPKMYFIFQGLCWFVSIVLLIVMYSFIIVNIRKANKRRSRFDTSFTSTTTLNSIGVNNVCRQNKLDRKRTSSHERDSQNSITKPSTFMDTSIKNTSVQVDGNAVKTTQLRDKDSGNRRNNVPKKLFSRDVNPLSGDDDNSAVLQNVVSRHPSIVEPLSELDQTPQTPFGLHDIEEHEPHFYLGDNNSSQNLVRNEISKSDNLNGDLHDKNMRAYKSFHGRCGSVHTSSSEGTYLDNTQRLNKHHMIISQNVEGLNDITSEIEIIDKGNLMQPERRTSLENINHPLKENQLSQATSLNQHDNHLNDANAFRRTRSLPARKHSRSKMQQTTNSPSNEFCYKKLKNQNEIISEGIDTSTEDMTSSAELTTNKLTKGVSSSHMAVLDTEGNVAFNDVITANLPPRKQSDNEVPQVSTNARSSRNSLQRQVSICSNDEYGHSSAKSTLYKRKQTIMKEIKTSKLAKVMFHVTLGFILSYLPHLSLQIAKIIEPDKMAELKCYNSTFFGFYHVALRSVFLNHAINPLIYGYFNKQFRQYCSELFSSPFRFFRKASNSSCDRTQSLSMDQA